MKCTLIATLLLGLALNVSASELCDSSIELTAMTAKNLGMTEISLVHSKETLQVLKRQQKAFNENANLEYSLGSTREEVETELSLENAEIKMLESDLNDLKRTLEKNISEAKTRCEVSRAILPKCNLKTSYSPRRQYAVYIDGEIQGGYYINIDSALDLLSRLRGEGLCSTQETL